MDNSDSKDKKIEQLNKKIERYQKALSSLKAVNATADIHIKRRMGKVEENFESVTERLEEMAKLLEEGLNVLSTRVNELDEKFNEVLTKQNGRRGTGNERLYESSRYEQPRYVSPRSKMNVTATTRNSDVPTFQLLQHMATQQPVDNAQNLSDYNHSEPPAHATSASIKATITNPKNEIERNFQEASHSQEVSSKNRHTELVKRTVTPIEEESLPRLAPSKIAEEVKEVTDIKHSISPLWNVFKKK